MGSMSPSKKKPGNRSGGGKQPRRRGDSLHVWIDPAIRQSLTEYVEQTEPETNATAVVELALRRYLESVGFWPRSS
jgi:hypothetical protein